MGNVSRNVTGKTVREQEVWRRAQREEKLQTATMTPGEKRRLAERLSSSGLNSRRVAVEILYLLPDTFVKAYQDLFHEAVLLGDEGTGAKADRDAELGRAKGGSRQGSRRGSSVFPIKSEEKARQKDWVDRQLRKLARAINTGEVGGPGERTKCGSYKAKDKELGKGCGKYIEEGFGYCPGCGRKARPDKKPGVQSSG